MRTDDLRARFERTLAGDASHVETMTAAAAIISEVLRRRGMEATLVGGAAMEFHASDVYTTGDLDLIVEGRSRDDLDSALTEFGFTKRGRHWVFCDLFVEVPGNWMSDPVDIVAVGDLRLRVIRREIVLADRIIGFKHWRATAYGAQAFALLALFGDSLDEKLLLHRLASEDAVDAFEALRLLARAGPAPIGEKTLDGLLQRLTEHRNSTEAGS